MKLNLFVPNSITYTILLSVCSEIKDIKLGESIHLEINLNKITLTSQLRNKLIEMYGKCGQLEQALLLFNSYKQTKDVDIYICKCGDLDRSIIIFNDFRNNGLINVDLYNSMINIYGIFGEGEKAIQLYKELIDNKIKPDNITFCSILNACSHSKLVDTAINIFDSMTKEFKIKPEIQHYTCIVDALSRSGRLNEAEEYINKINEPDETVLTTLLGGCRIYNDIDRAERTANKLIKLNPNNTSTYVLLSNIYASNGQWIKQAEIREIIKKNKLKKIPGTSTIIIDGKTHTFYANDEQHENIQEILQEITKQTTILKKNGYVPNISWVTQEMDESQAEYALCLHR